MFVRKSRLLSAKPRLLNLLLSFSFLLLALASKKYTGSFHQIANHYLGDLFIVGWLYFLLLFVLPELRPLIAAALIFTMSVSVEITQASLVSFFPGIPRWILFWTGTTFDPLDIFVYCLGVMLATITDLLFVRGAERRAPATE
jgi:hypothetical protein